MPRHSKIVPNLRLRPAAHDLFENKPLPRRQSLYTIEEFINLSTRNRISLRTIVDNIIDSIGREPDLTNLFTLASEPMILPILGSEVMWRWNQAAITNLTDDCVTAASISVCGKFGSSVHPIGHCCTT